jgi:hypothetical protein
MDTPLNLFICGFATLAASAGYLCGRKIASNSRWVLLFPLSTLIMIFLGVLIYKMQDFETAERRTRARPDGWKSFREQVDYPCR